MRGQTNAEQPITTQTGEASKYWGANSGTFGYNIGGNVVSLSISAVVPYGVGQMPFCRLPFEVKSPTNGVVFDNTTKSARPCTIANENGYAVLTVTVIPGDGEFYGGITYITK